MMMGKCYVSSLQVPVLPRIEVQFPRELYLISRHLDYTVKNDIDVQEQHEQLPSFYEIPKLHKKSMVPGSLLLQIHAPQNSSRHYLLLVLKQL